MFKLFGFSRTGLLLAAFATTAHGQIFQSLHSFSRTEGGGSKSQLIQARDGFLYGTASTGGDTNVSAFGYGTVFRATTSGVVSNFVSFQNTNGAAPWAGLIEANDGNFYGTTYSGGTSNLGTIFKLTTNGVLTTLVSFTNGNGALPIARLVQGSNGDLYGSTSSGGEFNSGTIFKISTSGELSTLVVFHETNGASPRVTLTEGDNGKFYGTTYFGGTNNAGTLFELDANGTLTTLISFGAPGTGKNPQGELFRAVDGTFLGTTFTGGENDLGTIFRANTNGALTTLVSFNSTNGSHPSGGLVQANDGKLYGATLDGGTANSGTVFRISFGGDFSSVFSFSTATNGITPLAGLVKADDGNLYGTTYSGGNSGGSVIGTLYRLQMPPLLHGKPAGNHIVLSWPTNVVGYALQTATNLNAPVTWENSADSPTVSGTMFNVTNLVSDPVRFYRLKK